MKVYSRLPGRSSVRLGLLVAILCGLLAPQVEAKPVKLKNVADTVASTVILSKMAAIIQATELGAFLGTPGPFTFFVPTNSAFAKIPPATLDAMLRPENKERLQHILLYHVINGKKWNAKDLLLMKVLHPCEGHPLSVRATHGGTQYVGKAKIVHSDIRCENGVINEIDTLLMPPEASMPPLIMTAAPPGPSVIPADIPVAPIAAPSTNAPSSQVQ